MSADESKQNPPETPPITEVHLESLYLEGGMGIDAEGIHAHSISLRLSGRPDHETEMSGELILDPNVCQLDDFGDTEICTKIAIRRLEVKVVLQHREDPSPLRRRYFEVTGPDLPEGLAFIVSARLERCYLKLDNQLVPLFSAIAA